MASKAKRKAKPKPKPVPKQKRLGSLSRARRPARSMSPVKSSRKTSKERPQRGRPANPEQSKVRDALQHLDKAFRQLELSGHALLKTVADLQDSAVDAHRSKLLRALVADQVMQDLSDARVAFETVPEEQVPEPLRPFTLMPQAVSEWLERNLGIRPCARRGQELEIPSERLTEFTVSGEVPEVLPTLLRVRVVSQGWQSATETLIKPSVVLLVGARAAGGA